VADLSDEILNRQLEAATELERCIAYAQLLIVSLRNGSDLSERETGAILTRFRDHGTKAIHELAAAGQILAAMRAQQPARTEAEAAESSTVH
jgi:hypothetical protein